MKKLILFTLAALFATFAYAETYTVPFTFAPGTGQVVKKSPALHAGDTVKCTFRTPDVLTNAGDGGNVFVTQPIGDALMEAEFGPVSSLSKAKRSGLLSLSYQFHTFPLTAATDYEVKIKVDGESPGINCKLNSGARAR